MIHSADTKDILRILEDYEKLEAERNTRQTAVKCTPYQKLKRNDKNIVDHVTGELSVDLPTGEIAFEELGRDALNPGWIFMLGFSGELGGCDLPTLK